MSGLSRRAAAGLLPLTENDELTLVVAPRGVAARRLYTIVNGAPELRRRIRLTTSERLAGFVYRNGGVALGERAAFGLSTSRPLFSAAPREKTWLLTPLFAMAAALGAVVLAPNLVATGFSVAFSLVFFAWIGLRLIGLFAAAKPPQPLPRRPDASLPIYTVIVALYREVAAIEQLIACLNALDWPPEKLDIKLVLEPDDHATRAALQAIRLGPPYRARDRTGCRAAHQAQGAQCCSAFRARRVRHGLRRRRPAGSRPVATRARGLPVA